MKTSLVWFKNDLRLHDNEALCRAIADADEVICCYCIEPQWFDKLELGFKKADIHRFKFLEQNVNDLQANLENIGGQLIISAESALTTIPRLVEKYQVKAIYAEQEYASEELNLLKQVTQKLPKTELQLFWGKTLYHIDDIPFPIHNIPLTSKAYRIPTTKTSRPRQTYKAPKFINSPKHIVATKFPSYKAYGFNCNDYNNAKPFLKGGESEALERLEHYTFGTENLSGYRWSRNKSLGLDYSSKFSPYLAVGSLSPRTIYETVKQYEQTVTKNQSTWWLIFELVWRDYFTFKGMRFGNLIFMTEGFKSKSLDFENHQGKFSRWKDGKTGIPFIDAHIRQLNQTGYMSNRGRVNCSSYFIHDLKIDWTWGAAYFESKLIDYDVTSNWLNWHVQAFEIYYTNPVHQSLKYKANNYIIKWIDELRDIKDDSIHAPWLFPELMEQIDYPNPIAVYKKWQRSINNILKKALS